MLNDFYKTLPLRKNDLGDILSYLKEAGRISSKPSDLNPVFSFETFVQSFNELPETIHRKYKYTPDSSQREHEFDRPTDFQDLRDADGEELGPLDSQMH